jgi:hypothetical protein
MIVAEVLATTVSFVHMSVICYVIVAPFVLTKVVHRVLYVYAVGSILVHWVTSNTLCVLTLVENWLRGTTNNESFIFKFVGPVYDLKNMLSDRKLRELVRIATFTLWCYNIGVIVSMCGSIEAAMAAIFLLRTD